MKDFVCIITHKQLLKNKPVWSVEDFCEGNPVHGSPLRKMQRPYGEHKQLRYTLKPEGPCNSYEPCSLAHDEL